MRKLLILWAVILLSQIGLFAAEQPITLRYNFPAGTELVFRILTASASRFRIASEPEDESTSKIDQTIRCRLLEIAPDGEMIWEKSVESGAISISDNGKEKDSDLPKGKVGFKLSPSGKISLIPDPEATEEEGKTASAMVAENSELDLLLPAIFFPLPKEPVKAGDTWEVEMPMTFLPLPLVESEPSKVSRLKIKSQLLELTRRGEKPCAHIHSEATLPLSQSYSRPDGLSLGTTGTMSATIDCYFDYSRSRTLAASTVMQFAVKVAPETPGPFEELMLTVKANTKTSLVE